MKRRPATAWRTAALVGGCLSGLGCADPGGGSPPGAEATTAADVRRDGDAGDPARPTGDYPLIPLPRLLGMADLAVTGKVTAVGDDTFVLQIDESLLGGAGAGEIAVASYSPPPFVPRRSLPYRRGQRLALFLRRPGPEESGRTWAVLGLAGEGEMRIVTGYVYLGPYALEGLEHWPLTVEDVTWQSQRLALADFTDAVRDYRRCFTWGVFEYRKNEKPRRRWTVSRRCPDDVLEAYRARSWLHEYLARESDRRVP